MSEKSKLNSTIICLRDDKQVIMATKEKFVKYDDKEEINASGQIRRRFIKLGEQEYTYLAGMTGHAGLIYLYEGIINDVITDLYINSYSQLEDKSLLLNEATKELIHLTYIHPKLTRAIDLGCEVSIILADNYCIHRMNTNSSASYGAQDFLSIGENSNYAFGVWETYKKLSHIDEVKKMSLEDIATSIYNSLHQTDGVRLGMHMEKVII